MSSPSASGNRKDRREHARQAARQAASLRTSALRQDQPAKVLEASHRLFELGRIADAMPGLRQAVAAHPDHQPLRTALAYALAATGHFGAAVDQYRTLLQREPASPGLMTNLSLLLLKTGQTDEASAWLLKAAELAPEHANTAYTLGELFEQQRRRDQAFHHYRRAVVLYSRQIGARPGAGQCNDLVKLASAQMWTGDLGGALANFDKAVALRPDHALALARRGLALAKLRRTAEAVESLKRAAAAEPRFAEVRRAIGDLLLDAGAAQAAQSHYRAAVRINPRDALAAYFLAAAKQSESPAAPPPGYVEQLFDDYAERFEKHLVDVLQYRAPELLCEAVQRVTQPPAASWNVIDLGCGTGLCGPLIRPFARLLTGVDLSAAMLDKAREKAVYDELLHEDVATSLSRFDQSIDLALSADVFIYLGSLTPIFAAAGRALRPGAWFAFTTEAHDGDGFVLDATGRYRHSRTYVEAEAAAQGLQSVHCEPIVARYQSHKPVISDVYILRRTG
jgi:predicted TPR repeat methyltransferase